MTSKTKIKYHFKIIKEKDGYSAQCLELEGCVTQANSKKELYANMQEALNLCLQERESSKDIVDGSDFDNWLAEEGILEEVESSAHRKLFEELKEGLQGIIAHQEGKLTLKSEFIEIPEPPKLLRSNRNRWEDKRIK